MKTSLAHLYQQHTDYVSDYDILVITKDRKSVKSGQKSRELE
ncbi:hypothetical protein [Dyadobacter sp. Leaf189]|nr:hypothetical protein [Dyadobacter sp. Leaf189]